MYFSTKSGNITFKHTSWIFIWLSYTEVIVLHRAAFCREVHQFVCKLVQCWACRLSYEYTAGTKRVHKDKKTILSLPLYVHWKQHDADWCAQPDLTHWRWWAVERCTLRTAQRCWPPPHEAVSASSCHGRWHLLGDATKSPLCSVHPPPIQYIL